MIPLRVCVAVTLLATPALSQDRIPSHCIALAAGAAQVMQASVGEPLAAATVRLRYLNHSAFLIETAGGLAAVTDFTGFTGTRAPIPDIVTMNNAHSTHWTDQPDPAIPHVLRGWDEGGGPQDHRLDLGEMLVRNVPTDVRDEGGVRRDGNSIFIFEVAGLCIGHLGHLHQIPSAAQYAAIGRLDVVMVPVDGAFTMDVSDMADIVRHLNARVVLPMHWFSEEGLARFLVQLKDDHTIVVPESAEIVLSRDKLPVRPEVVVLTPELFP